MTKSMFFLIYKWLCGVDYFYGMNMQQSFLFNKQEFKLKQTKQIFDKHIYLLSIVFLN